MFFHLYTSFKKSILDLKYFLSERIYILLNKKNAQQTNMTQFLPPNLLALFAPRDPLPFMPPVDKPTHEKKRQPYTGVADYLTQFEVGEKLYA